LQGILQVVARRMTTILVNPNRGTSSLPAGEGDPRSVHRRLPGYSATPLIDAAGIAGELGARHVYVKDESSRLGLPAFKILGASWATYRVLVERLGHEPSWDGVDELRGALAPLGPLTLVAATDGNHGRAVARVARLLGYASHILVPAGTSPARIDGIASEGASVTVVDGTYDDAVEASAALASDDALVISDTAWPGYADVPRYVIDGYSTIFAECDEQLGGAVPDVVVVQMGVGALAAAVVSHYARHASIVGVEPVSAACNLESAAAGTPVAVPGPHRSIMAGLNCGNVSPVAWPAVSRGVDVFVAIEDAATEQAMRDLAAEGVVAGETGAAGLGGLRALAEAGTEAHGIELQDRTVLLLCTEGATDPEAYERIVGRAHE
jgi:diaminopropionate ammonia-lyase